MWPDKDDGQTHCTVFLSKYEAMVCSVDKQEQECDEKYMCDPGVCAM